MILGGDQRVLPTQNETNALGISVDYVLDQTLKGDVFLHCTNHWVGKGGFLNRELRQSFVVLGLCV